MSGALDTTTPFRGQPPIGAKFNKLTVVGYAGFRVHPSGKRDGHWLCRCDCGNQVAVSSGNVKAGHIKSCGCLAKLNLKHGGFVKVNGVKGKHPLYCVWDGIIQRCTNPNNKYYHNYGGRGIKVCDKWRASFKSFREDMGPRPPGHLIERIDNNGHYEPNNCKWATRKEQMNNCRNNFIVEYRGQRLTMQQLSELSGVPYKTLEYRIKIGWGAERAANQPVQTHVRRT
jgi:hypothetical protein